MGRFGQQRRAKFYCLNADGQPQLDRETESWRQYAEAVCWSFNPLEEIAMTMLRKATNRLRTLADRSRFESSGG